MPRTPHLSSIVLLLLLSTFAAAQTTKRALIFAIGNYPKDSGWPAISSDYDVSFVQKALESQHFKDSNIKIVRDEAATVDGIKKSLDELVASSNPGDVVVIDFSSHGEQIEDETGHNVNGLEDCIVAYDAKFIDPDTHISRAQFETLKTGYLREDVFGSYVRKLRGKLGPNGDLVIFMDLCHTGVGTRGVAKVRGGKAALTSIDFKKNAAAAIDYDVNSSDDGPGMSPFEGFGAARSDELDYETTNDSHQTMGSLTYAISKVFADTSNITPITYRTLFAEIRGVMNDKSQQQHPVLFGNGADRQLFGGQFVPQKHFIEINKIEGLKITLDAGTLSGLDVGTRIAVYPVNTHDTANVKPLSTGEIKAAQLYESTAYIKQPLKVAQPALACVFVTLPVYKFAPLNIQIVQNTSPARGVAETFSLPEVTNMKKNLATLSLVKFDDQKPDLKIIKGKELDEIIIAADGSTFDTVRNAGTDTAKLKSEIQSYMRYVFLKNVKLTEPGIRLDIKLVPVHNGKADTSAVLMANPVYSFADGDTVMLWAHNPSRRTLYFNILDMQPNGVINPVVPIHSSEATIGAEQLAVEPGVSHLFNGYKITIGPPYGTEVFKIFVADKLIDMETIATNRGEGTRGSFTSIEGLVKDSYTTIGTRGVVPHTNSSGATYNLLFEIKEKK